MHLKHRQGCSLPIVCVCVGRRSSSSVPKIPRDFGGVRCRPALHISDGGRDSIRWIFRQIAETAKLVFRKKEI
jgi:hypothetical protein